MNDEKTYLDIKIGMVRMSISLNIIKYKVKSRVHHDIKIINSIMFFFFYLEAIKNIGQLYIIYKKNLFILIKIYILK